MSQFTSENLKQLRKALLSVYPSKGDLEIFVADGLGKNLEEITNEGNLTQDVFKLVQWANAKGLIDKLFQAFCSENETNPTVTALQQQLRQKATTPLSQEKSAQEQSAAPPAATSSQRPEPRHTFPIEVFISYSHKDEALKDSLHEHLAGLTRAGKIKPWQDRAIEAGTEWDAQIKAHLESAGIILLLITPPFINSEYCFDKEMQRAMERHEEGSARVIPIITRPCDWQDTSFSKLQVLPTGAKPITQWPDQDAALLDVVKGIRRTIDSLAAV